MHSVRRFAAMVGLLLFAGLALGAPPTHVRDTVVHLWASDPLHLGPSVHRWLRADGTFQDLDVVRSASRTSSSALPLHTGTYTYELNGSTARLRFLGSDSDIVPPELTLHWDTERSGQVDGFDPQRYDRSGFSLRPAAPLLGAGNVSCRAYVAKDKPGIAGFVLHGGEKRFLLVRAVGPSLGNYGVSDGLADPALLVDGQEPAYVGLDSAGFKGNAAAVSALAAIVGAFPLRPDAGDSVRVVQLTPGSHTIVVTSASGRNEGTALVEAYLLP